MSGPAAARQTGFTLLELALVILIVGLLLGGLLSPLATRIEQKYRTDTSAQLAEIQSVLLGYAMTHGHFPCPDCPDRASGHCATVQSALGAAAINDGREDGTDKPVTTAANNRAALPFALCATETGNLPWATLGVSAADAWGSAFIYRVDQEFADDTDGTRNCARAALNISFCIGSVGDADIEIDDAAGNTLARNIPAIVISPGANRHTPPADLSAPEQENRDGDTRFVLADYSKEAGADFDDLLTWISPSVLMYQMVKAERLP